MRSLLIAHSGGIAGQFESWFGDAPGALRGLRSVGGSALAALPLRALATLPLDELEPDEPEPDLRPGVFFADDVPGFAAAAFWFAGRAVRADDFAGGFADDFTEALVAAGRDRVAGALADGRAGAGAPGG